MDVSSASSDSAPDRCVIQITVQYRGGRASTLSYAFHNREAVQASLDLYYQECLDDLVAIGFPSSVFEVVAPATLEFELKRTQIRVIWRSLSTNTECYHRIRYSFRKTMEALGHDDDWESRSICTLLYHENGRAIPLQVLPLIPPPRQNYSVSTAQATSAAPSLPSGSYGAASPPAGHAQRVPPNSPRATASSSNQATLDNVYRSPPAPTPPRAMPVPYSPTHAVSDRSINSTGISSYASMQPVSLSALQPYGQTLPATPPTPPTMQFSSYFSAPSTSPLSSPPMQGSSSYPASMNTYNFRSAAPTTPVPSRTLLSTSLDLALPTSSTTATASTQRAQETSPSLTEVAAPRVLDSGQSIAAQANTATLNISMATPTQRTLAPASSAVTTSGTGENVRSVDTGSIYQDRPPSSLLHTARATHLRDARSQIPSSRPQTPRSSMAASPTPSAPPLTGSSNVNIARRSPSTIGEMKRKREADTSSASSSQNQPVLSLAATDGGPPAKRVRPGSSARMRTDASSSTSIETHSMSSSRALLVSERAKRVKAQEDLERMRRDYEAQRKKYEDSPKCGEGGYTCAPAARMQELLKSERDAYASVSAGRDEDREAYEELMGAMDALREEKAAAEERLAFLQAENAQLAQSLEKEKESHLTTRSSCRELTKQLEKELEYERTARETCQMEAAEARLETRRLAEAHRAEICDATEEKEGAVAALARAERALADLADSQREVPAVLEALDKIVNLSTDAPTRIIRGSSGRYQKKKSPISKMVYMLRVQLCNEQARELAADEHRPGPARHPERLDRLLRMLSLAKPDRAIIRDLKRNITYDEKTRRTLEDLNISHLILTIVGHQSGVLFDSRHKPRDYDRRSRSTSPRRVEKYQKYTPARRAEASGSNDIALGQRDPYAASSSSTGLQRTSSTSSFESGTTAVINPTESMMQALKVLEKSATIQALLKKDAPKNEMFVKTEEVEMSLNAFPVAPMAPPPVPEPKRPKIQRSRYSVTREKLRDIDVYELQDHRPPPPRSRVASSPSTASDYTRDSAPYKTRFSAPFTAPGKDLSPPAIEPRHAPEPPKAPSAMLVRSSQASEESTLTRELWDLRRQMTALKAKEEGLLERLKEINPSAVLEKANGATKKEENREGSLADLEVERKKRIQAEEIWEDARKEYRAPLVVPAMLDAFEKLARIAGDALMASTPPPPPPTMKTMAPRDELQTNRGWIARKSL
ncbi:hypothetical protein EIP91_011490 [Steccherinum ochraceum]|uniref:Uncharacterized protein n=1 Tax=Steccherinum ochraceum TaxID=92696 RepID=A0A4R0RPP8_9APHY|nr:hypothetical protein EIP91_011490 [Steccherinum ochraceum]